MMGHMMGRKKAAVSALAIKQKYSKLDGMHAIGEPPGLYLYVRGDSKLWMLRYSAGGRRRDMGIGRYGELTLEQAREKAVAERLKIRDGLDPLAIRHADRQTEAVARAKAITFAECAEKYIAAHRAGWSNPKHAAQWENTLATYAHPIIGDLPVEAVDTGLVLQILEPVWATKNETATRLRGRIEVILDWATVRGYRQGENPARWRGHLDMLLPKPSKIQKVEHHAALPYAEMPAFWAKLMGQAGMGALALQLLILTATRSGEIRGVAWREIDLDGKLWTIPAERMKANREHRIPLSEPAIDLLKRVPKLEGSELVFPGMRQPGNVYRPLSDMTLTAVLKRMGRGDLTAHGFRSTFRDWVAEATNHPNEVAEMALAHAVGNQVEAAYRRGDLFDKRRTLMHAWANFCATPAAADEGVVVPIRGAA